MQAFISYSKKDKSRRVQICELLQENDVNAVYDDEFIRTGDRLSNSIFPKIEKSRCLIVVHTKYSTKSDWVVKEVNHAVLHAIPVIVITFGNVPLPPEFPKSLSDVKNVRINSRFTASKKNEFVQHVSRYYFRKQAPIVTLLNIKGGVGKTALSANLFGCMHELNQKSILLLDLDPQHNLTQLLLSHRRMTRTIMDGANVMAMFRGFGKQTDINLNELEPDDIKRVFDRCIYPLKNLEKGETSFDLIPGSWELVTYFLGHRHQHFDANKVSWQNFRAFIDYCRSRYDVIVIDVNPGASLMTEVALDVSTHVLSPIRPDRFSKYGIGLLHQMLDLLEISEEDITLLGIMNGVNRKEIDEIEVELRSHDQPDWIYPHKILDSRIAYSKRLEARASSPTVDDLTKNLAYQPSFGSQAIRNDLRTASEELIGELGL